MRSLILLFLPLLAASCCGAAGFAETFDSEPTQRGWSQFGDASLFHWNAEDQSLDVTWDSMKPNSYFYRSLGNILARNDDFALGFDLRLASMEAGVNPAKPSTFEIAVGFINLHLATNVSFNRGTGQGSPNLVEFDYFPPADFIAATVSPAIVSSNSQFATIFAFPLEMTTGDWFHVELAYTGSNKTLMTTMTRNGAAFGPIQNITLDPGFTDFRVDAVAIASYNDTGDAFGSVRARGTLDNLSVTLPPPPVSELTARLSDGVVQFLFISRTNWNYTLERTQDFLMWQAMPPASAGIAGRLILSDSNAPASSHWFYRVRADRP